jgi:CRISPR-associated endonuclease/helicase Cas3
MQTFDEFFRAATATPALPHGHAPHGYQSRIAAAGLPAVVQAPTGTGKTGVILAWLWRRLYGPDPEAVPRRLVYALPQRSLVEQVAGEAGRWLQNLGLADQVALHVVMGGEGGSQRLWRVEMDRPAIVIGTVDSLVSKALNRGYGIARAIYPIDFALVTNGAHWVVDEIQLCPESTTTLRQLAAFAKDFGTAEPFGLTCMSATVPEVLLNTVDNPSPTPGDMVGIEPGERTGELAVRLDASRVVRRLDMEPGGYREIAAAAVARHRPGTLMLVVVNTVDAARQVYRALDSKPIPHMLLHSRFRTADRARLMGRLNDEPADAGRIVVATQVVEAGIDINASVLITEAAPWPSIVQRAGRCNRTGLVRDAELLWLPPLSPQPYEQADVDAASAELDRLEGRSVTSEELLARSVEVTETPVSVLRRSDFAALFDTAPDLSGADLDIAPYVRDSDDLDVQLAWATWTADAREGRPSAEPGPPPAEAKAPPAEFRCRVPLRELGLYLKRDGVAVWRLDQVLGRWTQVGPQARARPGEVLIASADSGGYDPEVGFDPVARGAVPGSPELRTAADAAAGAEDSYRADSASVEQPEWITLDRHSQETREQAGALLAALQPSLPAGAAETAVTAAYLHDVGKAHETWQNALCRLAPQGREDEIRAQGPWAKSGGRGRLWFAGGVAFRHELASLLLLDGPLRDVLAGVPDSGLARYLVLAHHGKLRVQVRDPGDLAVLARMNGRARDQAATPEVGDGPVPEDGSHVSALLGLVQGATIGIPPLLGQPATELTVDLGQFSLGGEHSWTRTALALRERYGPFVLAYLETIVRIADWRASDPKRDPASRKPIPAPEAVR